MLSKSARTGAQTNQASQAARGGCLHTLQTHTADTQQTPGQPHFFLSPLGKLRSLQIPENPVPSRGFPHEHGCMTMRRQ